MRKQQAAALLLALAMIATISVFAAQGTERALTDEAQAAETAGTAMQDAKEAAYAIFRDAAGAAAETATAEDDAALEKPELEEAPAPEPDAEGTLSFANIGSRMLEHYYPLLALQESIKDIESHDYEHRYEDLREDINQLANLQWYMVLLGKDSSSLQSSYDTLRKSFDDIKEGVTQKDDEDAVWMYHNGQNMAIVGGEGLYIQIKGLQAQDEQITHALEQIDRSLQELELRQKLGQIPALTVEQLRTTRAQTASQQQSLRTGIETALLTLKYMVGAELGEPLELGALPKVTDEQLAAMDLEADLERAKAASYDLYDANKQIETFREDTYEEVIERLGESEKIFEVSQVKHAMRAMQIRYEDALLSFELNFRALYAQVKDAAQVLDTARVLLDAQEREYAVSAVKFKQGSISANALADAKDKLTSAKDSVASAERDLFSKYRSYCWAAEYGILNG